MPKFCLQMEIRNALIDWDGKVTRSGAFKSVWVKAADIEAAAAIAIETLENDPELNGLFKNSEEDPPTFHLESWQQLSPFARLKKHSGATWYKEEAQ